MTFPRGRPCTAHALRATFRLDSPVKNPHTDPFQTPSKLGHPSYPSLRQLRTTFPSHQMPKHTRPCFKELHSRMLEHPNNELFRTTVSAGRSFTHSRGQRYVFCRWCGHHHAGGSGESHGSRRGQSQLVGGQMDHSSLGTQTQDCRGLKRGAPMYRMSVCKQCEQILVCDIVALSQWFSGWMARTYNEEVPGARGRPMPQQWCVHQHVFTESMPRDMFVVIGKGRGPQHNNGNQTLGLNV